MNHTLYKICNLLMTLFIISFATGCAVLENISQQVEIRERQREIKQQVVEAKMRVAIEGKCKGYGFDPGTTSFSSCVMQLDQQAQLIVEAEKSRSQLESNCLLAMAQATSAPTRTGSAGEGIQNGNIAYERCMAGLPPPRQTSNIICRAEGKDQVYCFNQ